MYDQTSVSAFAVRRRNVGSQSSTSFPSWKDKQGFPVDSPESTTRVVPLRCCKGLSQQAWNVQTLHIPKIGQGPWLGPERQLLRPWNRIPDKSVIVYLWPWTIPDGLYSCCDLWWGSGTTWYQFDLWNSWRLRSKGQPQGWSMPTWLTPDQTLNSKASLVGSTLYVLSHIVSGRIKCSPYKSTGKG